ncbi:uncharacterized protein HD556DRAFT_1313598 [Suillus plorans]|uniref:Uncharacterized protein n=1 Tax=Suillus plorans TaxID=116603 RepID=A0A9P7ADS3_9AGAM|nr:uncharacterized protein HD556DRAFT_1313598 [Suillus plorans]KAG1786244.1 hypothetical protein HD556DRAFT_1313598 [Suillus plorans]
MNEAVPHGMTAELELFNPHSISTTCHPDPLSQRLGKEVTIMLAWGPNLDGLYEDFFPTVWKSILGYRNLHCPACRLLAPEHRSRVGRSSALRPSSTSITNASHNAEQQETTLTEANDVYHFSPLPRQCVRVYV